MKRTIRVYTLLVVVFGLIISATLELGQRTYQPHSSATAASVTTSVPSNRSVESPALLSALRDNIQEPLDRLLLQFLFILIAARVLGSLFRRIGQPAVIGELIAGILLGPSLVGRLSPNVFTFVFPTNSLGNLQLLSQIGVCLFIFLIGMELDWSHIRQRAHVAVSISHTSILFPYVLEDLIDCFWEKPLAFSLLVYQRYKDYITDMFATRIYDHQPSPALDEFRKLLNREGLREKSYETEDLYSVPIGSRFHPARAAIWEANAPVQTTENWLGPR